MDFFKGLNERFTIGIIGLVVGMLIGAAFKWLAFLLIIIIVSVVVGMPMLRKRMAGNKSTTAE